MTKVDTRVEVGTLYVVATPIGNLEDLGARAGRLLGEVDLILAEDTRHTRRLLEHLGIATRMQPLHDHNERREASRICDRVEAGAHVALVSDAGTPLVSDPGFHLVRALHERGLPVVPVPGPSAFVCALSAAGLPSDRFAFEGFLPSRRAARRARLEALRHEPRTLIFYESPRRVRDCLEDLVSIFGAEREGAIGRELTKRHENVHRDSLGGLAAWLEARPEIWRGEFVLLVGPPPRSQPPLPPLEPASLLEALLDELPLARAVALAARLCGRKRNELYALALALRDGSPGPPGGGDPGEDGGGEADL